MNDLDQLAYRPKSAARVIDLSEREVYNLLASGKLRAKKHGRAVLITRDELQRFVDQLEDAS